MISRFVAFVSVTIVLAVPFASCASGSQDQSGRADVELSVTTIGTSTVSSSTPALGSLTVPEKSYDEYLAYPYSVLNVMVSGSTSQLRWDLQFQLIEECMSLQGWDFVPPPPTTGEANSPFAGTVGQFLQIRSTFGYVSPVPEETTHLELVRKFESGLDSLGPDGASRYLAALYGPSMELPDDRVLAEADSGEFGCYGTARQPDLVDTPLLQLAPFDYNDILSQVEADPSVLAGKVEWAECMASQGFVYESTIDPIKEFSARLPEDPPSIEELSVATADSLCYVQHVFAPRRNAEVAAIETIAETYPEWAAAARVALTT